MLGQAQHCWSRRSNFLPGVNLRRLADPGGAVPGDTARALGPAALQGWV